MEILKEVESLKKHLLPCLLLWLLLAFFFFSFGLKEFKVFDVTMFLPLPTLHSFSVQFFEKIQKDLLPPGVELIVVNPFSGFLAQTTISLSLGFISGLPLFLFQLIKYLFPALLPSERSKIVKIWLPSVFLFLTGCFFAYFLLIPVTLRFLYTFPALLGAVSFFAIDEFVIFVLGSMMVAGIMFLLPIFMLLLSSLGIVERGFWKTNWRAAVLVFLIFSAIITPEGTGATMLIMFFPLCGLYFFGCLFTLNKGRFLKV